MHRILVEIPLPFGLRMLEVPSYGVMLTLAFIIAMYLTCRRGRKIGLSPQVVMDIGLYSVVAGIVGARFAFILVEYKADPLSNSPLLDMFAIWRGGLIFQGGLLMALVVCIWYLRTHQLPAGKIADISAPGVALGVAIGRVGCFLNGCCWGKLCAPDFPLGVVFADGESVFAQQVSRLDHGSLQPLLGKAGYPHSLASAISATDLPLAVHPTQLYTSLALLVVFFLLLYLEKLPRLFDGMIMLAFVLLHALVRFGVEFVRDDTPLYLAGGHFPGLKFGQIAALLTFLAGMIFFLYLWRRARPAASRPPAKPEI